MKLGGKARDLYDEAAMFCDLVIHRQIWCVEGTYIDTVCCSSKIGYQTVTAFQPICSPYDRMCSNLTKKNVWTWSNLTTKKRVNFPSNSVPTKWRCHTTGTLGWKETYYCVRSNKNTDHIYRIKTILRYSSDKPSGCTTQCVVTAEVSGVNVEHMRFNCC